MLSVYGFIGAGKEEVVYVRKEGKASQNLIGGALEGLCRVSQSRRIWMYSYWLKGVILPIFGMSAGLTRIWWKSLTITILEKILETESLEENS